MKPRRLKPTSYLEDDLDEIQSRAFALGISPSALLTLACLWHANIDPKPWTQLDFYAHTGLMHSARWVKSKHQPKGRARAYAQGLARSLHISLGGAASALAKEWMAAHPYYIVDLDETEEVIMTTRIEELLTELGLDKQLDITTIYRNRGHEWVDTKPGVVVVYDCNTAWAAKEEDVLKALEDLAEEGILANLPGYERHFIFCHRVPIIEGHPANNL